MHQSVDDVLLATDFSPGAEEAARVALDYTRVRGAHLHLLHVVPDARAAEAAAQRMVALAGRLRGVPLATRVEAGRAADRILEYAAARGVGLIVLGRHGHSNFTPARLGSVAEEVTRRARCPVLAVPEPAATAEGTAPGAGPTAAPARRVRRCLVCGTEAEELICEGCRARIRGQSLQQKWEEQSGRPHP
jgi:nucleotide-binding universal stress UspA family protein